MIVEMQKITLLVDGKHREEALKGLRDLGVVHVHHVKTPVSENISRIEREIEKANKALMIVGAGPDSGQKAGTKQAEETADNILALVADKENLQRELDEYAERDSWFKVWGDVSLASLQKLEDAGIWVRFYSGEKKTVLAALDEKPAGHVQTVYDDGKMVRIAWFALSKDDTLDLTPHPMPPVEYADLQENIQACEAQIAQIDKNIEKLGKKSDTLYAWLRDLDSRLEFARVHDGMGQDDRIVYLEGFCPAGHIDDFKKAAQKSGWGYMVREPDQPEHVPTKIEYNKYSKLSKPVFGFMGTIPGYTEFDVSGIFLTFLSIFFAMLVGDAGYGLLFLGLTLLFHKKAPKDSPKEAFFLLYLMSGFTIVWGALSGVWFGYEPFARLPVLSAFKQDFVYGYDDATMDSVMLICFIIGGIQLSIAHLLQAWRNRRSPKALGDIGWVAILWGIFLLALQFVLGEKSTLKTMAGPLYNLLLSPEGPANTIMVSLIITGASLVLLFADFRKNILKGALATLGNLPLDMISSFSDVVSYLRLFAVGFASVTVAKSFNEMALGDGNLGIIGGLIAAIVLFLGHGLNIILAMMAVVVHGIRLNMLEFSGHLNMQWSGKAYEPFKK